MPESIIIEPNWPGVRRYVRNVALSDPPLAQEIASAMNSEAPFTVGITETCEFLGGFATEQLAAEFIDKLDPIKRERGDYYLDGKEESDLEIEVENRRSASMLDK